MNLDFLFYPKSVAVIGASNKEGKIGNAIMKNLINFGFKGKIYPVNVKESEVMGLKAYKSVLEIPGEVDVAVIAIPGRFVPQVLEECGQKGVKGAVVISAGFKEAGNVELEEKLVEVARKWNIRVVGPNCLGITNIENGFDCTFNPPE
ncbi:CoA-binding protein, partial [Thermococci archaeon]